MFEPWKSKGVDAPIFIGLGITASDPCLAGVLRVCSFVLFTIWVTPENRLAKLALRGSSVLSQYFRGPQMACDSGWVKTLSVHVHKPASTLQGISGLLEICECLFSIGQTDID